MKSASPLGVFERYLSLWVALGIIIGVKLGLALPGLFQLIARLEYANVNFVVAVLIWVMIYPMMVSVDFASIREVGRKPKGLCITLVVNWLVKPFTMALLGVLFFNYIFAINLLASYLLRSRSVNGEIQSFEWLWDTVKPHLPQVNHGKPLG